LDEFKKKIEEISLNGDGVRVQKGIRTLSLSTEESRLGEPRLSQEGSKDEEFGSTENQVGEEIKLS
jgi:hypothetical protein